MKLIINPVLTTTIGLGDGSALLMVKGHMPTTESYIINDKTYMFEGSSLYIDKANPKVMQLIIVVKPI